MPYTEEVRQQIEQQRYQPWGSSPFTQRYYAFLRARAVRLPDVDIRLVYRNDAWEVRIVPDNPPIISRTGLWVFSNGAAARNWIRKLERDREDYWWENQ